MWDAGYALVAGLEGPKLLTDLIRSSGVYLVSHRSIRNMRMTVHSWRLLDIASACREVASLWQSRRAADKIP